MSKGTTSTIYDVARKAGVSPATVSRLINDAASVREETRKRVLEAIEELDFIPQRGARPGTKNRLPADIARPPVVFLQVGDFMNPEQSPVTIQLLRELERAADNHRLPYDVIHIPEIDPSSTVRDIVGKDVKGVFLRTSNMHDVTEASVKWLDGLSAVQVLGENPDDSLWMDHLTPDHVTVGNDAARYLLEKGCETLVYAGVGPMNKFTLDRCTSFVNIARGAGKSVSVFHETSPERKADIERKLSPLSTNRTVVVESRPELLQTLKRELGSTPYGLFVPSDFKLAFLLSQLQVLGEQFLPTAAVGCNRETRAFAELGFSPATFDLRIDTLAEQAVHRLLRRIQNPDSPFLRMMIAPALIS